MLFVNAYDVVCTLYNGYYAKCTTSNEICTSYTWKYTAYNTIQHSKTVKAFHTHVLQDEWLTQSVKEKPQYFVAHVEIRK